MGEIIPRDYYDPARPKREARKAIARIEQEAIVRQRALEAEARNALDRLEANRHLATAEDLLRIKGTYDLTDYASLRATLLDRAVELESDEGSPLRQIHRSFEATAAVTAQQVIYRHGTER